MKEYKEQKQDAFEGLTETFKPIIKSQEKIKESIDEQQNKLIDQLQTNQNQIVKAIEFDPKKAITFEGDPLPDLDDEEDEDIQEEEDEDIKEKKPKVKTLNLNKGINDEYKEVLELKGFKLPNTILEKKFKC